MDFEAALKELMGLENLGSPTVGYPELERIIQLGSTLPPELKTVFLNIFKKNCETLLDDSLKYYKMDVKQEKPFLVQLLKILNNNSDSAFNSHKDLLLKAAIIDAINLNNNIDRKALIEKLGIDSLEDKVLDDVNALVKIESRFLFKQVKAYNYFLNTDKLNSDLFEFHADNISNKKDDTLVQITDLDKFGANLLKLVDSEQIGKVFNILEICSQLPTDKRRAFLSKCENEILINGSFVKSVKNLIDENILDDRVINRLFEYKNLVETLTNEKLSSLFPENSNSKKTILAIEAFNNTGKVEKKYFDQLGKMLTSVLITEDKKIEIVKIMIKENKSTILKLPEAKYYLSNILIRNYLEDRPIKDLGISFDDAINALKEKGLIDDEKGTISKRIIEKSNTDTKLKPLLIKAISAALINKNTTKEEIISLAQKNYTAVLEAFNEIKNNKMSSENPHFEELYRHITFRTDPDNWTQISNNGWGGRNGPDKELTLLRSLETSPVVIDGQIVPYEILKDFGRLLTVSGAKLQLRAQHKSFNNVEELNDYNSRPLSEKAVITVYKELLEKMDGIPFNDESKKQAAFVAMMSMFQTFEAVPAQVIASDCNKNQVLYSLQDPTGRMVEFKIENNELIVSVSLAWNIKGDTLLDNSDVILNKMTAKRKLAINIETGEARALGEEYSKMEAIPPEAIINFMDKVEKKEFWRLCQETYGLDKKAVINLVTSRDFLDSDGAMRFFERCLELNTDWQNYFLEKCHNGNNETLLGFELEYQNIKEFANSDNTLNDILNYKPLVSFKKLTTPGQLSTLFSIVVNDPTEKDLLLKAQKAASAISKVEDINDIRNILFLDSKKIDTLLKGFQDFPKESKVLELGGDDFKIIACIMLKVKPQEFLEFIKEFEKNPFGGLNNKAFESFNGKLSDEERRLYGKALLRFPMLFDPLVEERAKECLGDAPERFQESFKKDTSKIDLFERFPVTFANATFFNGFRPYGMVDSNLTYRHHREGNHYIVEYQNVIKGGYERGSVELTGDNEKDIQAINAEIVRVHQKILGLDNFKAK